MLHHEDYTGAPSKPFEKVRYGNVMLLKPFARGGMAELYLAKQERDDGSSHQVVVKQPLRKHRSSRLHQRMMMDEANIGKHLVHPNIVRMLDWGIRGKMPYIVLEYVRGPSVRNLLNKLADAGEKLSREEVLYILTQVLSALSYAHTLTDDDGVLMKVVHRDVTPDNILLTAAGTVKLIDFGVARATNRSERTQTGMVKGKLRYFAPEQLSDAPFDHRVDQYALALTVCEMLTGSRVVDADSQPAMVSQVLQGASARINNDSAMQRALGPLRGVLLRALAQNPADRFESCAAMIEALQELTLNAEPDQARARLAHRIGVLFNLGEEAEEPQPVEPTLLWRTPTMNVAMGGIGTLAVASLIFGAVHLASHWHPKWPSFKPHMQATLVSSSETTAGMSKSSNVVSTSKSSSATAGIMKSSSTTIIGAPRNSAAPAPAAPAIADDEPVAHTSVLSRFTSTVAKIFSSTPPVATVQTIPAAPRAIRVSELPDGRLGRRNQETIVSQDEGTLDVSCLRWCEITVDGVALRATSPMRNRHLPVGSYLIEAVNPPTGQVALQRVTIQQGEHTLVQFRL